MRTILLALSALCAFALNAATFKTGVPSTTNNDDTCDVAVLPAATLLLPYFEVEVNAPPATARTTLFTVVNTSQYPRIARVTLWTDLGYPVVNFNLFLTGYDAQSINLYDVLSSGAFIVPGAPALCATNPGPISADIVTDLRNALTIGRIAACGSSVVGLVHTSASGYATIDLVKSCGINFPTAAAYYDELLYDNVLTGDYQTLDSNPVRGNYASGSPLVHIRAIPEGGSAGVVVSTDLPYTFYDRYTPRNAPAMDRRQPLPALFAAPFIEGGTGAFNTNFQIWREGLVGADASCADYAKNVFSSGSAPAVTEMVRFDEHENPTTQRGFCGIETCVNYRIFPETSSTPTSADIFPSLSGYGDTGGWMYLNLSNGGSPAYSRPRPSQNWVVAMTSAEGRYSVMFDATMIANGCTPRRPKGAGIGAGP